MPELPAVQPGEIIASDHINLIARRTVQRYATFAELGAENPTPEEGDLAYVAEWNALIMYSSGAWGAVFAATFGTVSAPSFSFSSDRASGMFRQGASTVGFVGGGVLQFRSGNASFPGIITEDGSAANPGVRFDGDQTNGMYSPAAGSVALAAAGLEAFRATSNRGYLKTVITDTTANAATARISEADGRVQISTSARRYKSDIDYATDYLADLDLQPVTFHHDGDDADFIGFIADDIGDLDTRAGDYGADGQINNYDLRAVVAILAAKVARLEAQLNG